MKQKTKRNIKAALLLGALGSACVHSPPPKPSRPTVISAPKPSIRTVRAPAPSGATAPLVSLAEFKSVSIDEPSIFVKEGYHVAFANSGDLSFVAGKRGGLLIEFGDVGGARLVRGRHFDQIGLAPNGKYGFAIDDQQLISVLDVEKVRFVRTIRPKGHPSARFRKDGALAVYDGCELRLHPFPEKNASTLLAPRLCGIAEASDDGRFWTIAQTFDRPGTYLDGVNAEYVVVVDAETLTVESLGVTGTEARPIALCDSIRRTDGSASWTATSAWPAS